MSASGATPRCAIVEALLTDLHSSPVRVVAWERLEPWAIARVTLRGIAALRTVVVKWVRDRPGSTRTEPWRLHTEVAALRHLSDDLGLALAPRVLAADLSGGLVVLEDLAPRTALDGLLRRDGAAAHADRLAAFARARGELGASTAGHAGRYLLRRTSLGPADPAAADTARFARLRNRAPGQAAALGVPLAGRVATELDAVLTELSDPGPFGALSNGDAETNNVLVHESGAADARLIDFESAAYTHALLDAVCLHVPGPAWMTVGDPVATGLADHHRHALARGVPEAEDDRRYGTGLAAACLFWAIARLQRFGALDVRVQGDPSRPQLIETLEAAARTAEHRCAFPHLAGWTRRTAALLRHRWPDADLDLTDPVAFPPYTPRHP
ncbi:phosphotransferase [Streptomyces sp. NBC_01808]|uniref:hypothetical protein n=1 Tax=Streptomyces sp. NBC_01808 TaxID=2975947 RepID=UPI002DD7A5E1|nr:hypothetical protein [Streptomyces sp. NBC_01808]WSA37677.1 phosphotransferase [Streptomyces sp. NBC_01808]